MLANSCYSLYIIENRLLLRFISDVREFALWFKFTSSRFHARLDTAMMREEEKEWHEEYSLPIEEQTNSKMEDHIDEMIAHRLELGEHVIQSERQHSQWTVALVGVILRSRERKNRTLEIIVDVCWKWKGWKMRKRDRLKATNDTIDSGTDPREEFL